MKAHAMDMSEAILRSNFESFGRLVGKTWIQNQALDCGTNPPAVAAIIEKIKDEQRADRVTSVLMDSVRNQLRIEATKYQKRHRHIDLANLLQWSGAALILMCNYIYHFYPKPIRRNH